MTNNACSCMLSLCSCRRIHLLSSFLSPFISLVFTLRFSSDVCLSAVVPIKRGLERMLSPQTHAVWSSFLVRFDRLWKCSLQSRPASCERMLLESEWDLTRVEVDQAWLWATSPPTPSLKLTLTLKAGLHVRRKHKHKHKRKPRVNRDDASTSARKKKGACACVASSRFTRGLCLRLCLRRPGSHVAYACACAHACACVVRVNQPYPALTQTLNLTQERVGSWPATAQGRKSQPITQSAGCYSSKLETLRSRIVWI